MLYERVEGFGALGFFGWCSARPDSANFGSEFLFLLLQCTTLVADGGSGQANFSRLACLPKIRTRSLPAKFALFWPPVTLLFAFERREVIGLLLLSAIHVWPDIFVPGPFAAFDTHPLWLGRLVPSTPFGFRVASAVRRSGSPPVPRLSDQIELVTRVRPMLLPRQPCEGGEEFRLWLLEDSPTGLLLALGHGFPNQGVHSLERFEGPRDFLVDGFNARLGHRPRYFIIPAGQQILPSSLQLFGGSFGSGSGGRKTHLLLSSFEGDFGAKVAKYAAKASRRFLRSASSEGKMESTLKAS